MPTANLTRLGPIEFPPDLRLVAPPANHPGLDRINFCVKGLTAAMIDLGFEQLGPVGGWLQLGIVFFLDPDGAKIQFAGPQTEVVG